MKSERLMNLLKRITNDEKMIRHYVMLTDGLVCESDDLMYIIPKPTVHTILYLDKVDNLEQAFIEYNQKNNFTYYIEVSLDNGIIHKRFDGVDMFSSEMNSVKSRFDKRLELYLKKYGTEHIIVESEY